MVWVEHGEGERLAWKGPDTSYGKEHDYHYHFLLATSVSCGSILLFSLKESISRRVAKPIFRTSRQEDKSASKPS